MVTDKIEQLSGSALDWSVAKSLGATPKIIDGKIFVDAAWLKNYMHFESRQDLIEFRPSVSFDQGGQLINHIGIDVRQYKMCTHQILNARHYDAKKGDLIVFDEIYKREMVHRPNIMPEHHLQWYAKEPESGSMIQWVTRKNHMNCVRGNTFLVAGMRWLVIKFLGDNIEVPKSLVEE